MIPLLVRVLKRLLVLLVGIALVYISIWKVFPYFDHRLYKAVALFVTYVVMAYGVVPALFRGFRLFSRPRHIPLYCVTPDGFASDPVNIGIIGTRRQMILAMEKAGWQVADPKNIKTVLRVLYATFFRKSYPTAPMSSLYLFGRKQDVAFEIEIPGTRGQRHHVRFWATNVETPEAFNQHVRFWRGFHSLRNDDSNKQLWVGAATKDIGFAPIRHNAQVSHMIDPNTNAERELIVDGLTKAKCVVRVQTLTIEEPYRLNNRVWRGFLLSDGVLKICDLR